MKRFDIVSDIGDSSYYASNDDCYDSGDCDNGDGNGSAGSD